LSTLINIYEERQREGGGGREKKKKKEGETGEGKVLIAPRTALTLFNF
jgi:hypothetical protein